MEITQYLAIARRWLWLLILGTVLGLAGGYAVYSFQTPVYQASTRVVVSRASLQTASGTSTGTGNIYDYFLSDQVLIQTYVELLKASAIFDQVSEIVNYPVSAGKVSASQVGDTRIINITVEDGDPQRAADIANAVVQALIAQNDELEAGRYKATDESLQVQIKQVEDQISKYQDDLANLSSTSVDEQIKEVEQQMAPLQVEVTQLQKDIAVLTPATSADKKAKVAELQARLDQIQPLLTLYQNIYTNLKVSGAAIAGSDPASNNPGASRIEKTLTLYQQIYLNLINTREAIRLARMQNTQSVTQIEPATPPSKPIRPLQSQNVLIGGALGLALVAGIVFLIEFLDDTLRTPEDAERILEAPTIGYIASLPTENGDNDSDNTNGIFVSKNPRSPISEAFRTLRTNLEFASVDKPLRTILVTSAEASDGKSTVASNLAAIFAQGGKRVMLIDCDLRRPRVHRKTGVQNKLGMTDLFRGTSTLDDVINIWSDSGAIEISVITSGSLPPNPAELLGSHKMNSLLEEMMARADIIVIDSPPSMVADSVVLASKVDGVVVVTQPGKTHTGSIRAFAEQMSRAGAHIIGIILNRIPSQGGYYYYGGYKYYSNYYTNNAYLSPEESIERKPRKSSRSPLFSRFTKKDAPADISEENAETMQEDESSRVSPSDINQLLNRMSMKSMQSDVTGKTAEKDPVPVPSPDALKKIINPEGWKDGRNEERKN